MIEEQEQALLIGEDKIVAGIKYL